VEFRRQDKTLKFNIEVQSLNKNKNKNKNTGTGRQTMMIFVFLLISVCAPLLGESIDDVVCHYRQSQDYAQVLNLSRDYG
jgi:hypothetical protein